MSPGKIPEIVAHVFFSRNYDSIWQTRGDGRAGLSGNACHAKEAKFGLRIPSPVGNAGFGNEDRSEKAFCCSKAIIVPVCRQGYHQLELPMLIYGGDSSAIPRMIRYEYNCYLMGVRYFLNFISHTHPRS